MFEFSSSTTQSVKWSLLDDLGISVNIKRDDLLHPIVSGNKWRKLRYLVEDVRNKGCQQMVSMGGNWSNHLHALAYLGKELSIKTHAFVRAHPNQVLTPTLVDCRQWGMSFDFMSRKEYAALRAEQSWDSYHEQFPSSYWLSEGGFSPLAMQGVSDMAHEIGSKVKGGSDDGFEYDYIFVGCGSGATLCGLAQAFPNSYIVGVAAFSGAEYLQPKLRQHIQYDNWTIDTKHHCGGFAKTTSELEKLISEIEQNNSFELDQVYNGKVFLALKSWLQFSRIPKGSRVLVIHTGGLQGTRSA